MKGNVGGGGIFTALGKDATSKIEAVGVCRIHNMSSWE